MSRPAPRARKSKSATATGDADAQQAIPRDQTPEAAAARKKAYEDANRIAKRYIIPALILVPILLFLAFYTLYGNGSSGVAKPRFSQQQQRQPVWTAPSSSSSRKANKKAKKAEGKPVEAAEPKAAASSGSETKMDQKQTEEFARLMMEQLAKLAKGNNPDLKLTFNNEEINIGGGASDKGTAAPAAGKENADGKTTEGGDVDADEEIDLE